MAQITVLERDRTPDWQTALGQGLGAGIGKGIDAIAQFKLRELESRHASGLKRQQDEMERQRYSKGLEPYVGRETASFLANLDPQERKSALQNLGSLQQLQSSLRGGQSQAIEPSFQNTQQQSLQQPQLSQNQQQPFSPQSAQSDKVTQDVLGAIANMIGTTPEQALQEIQNNPELQDLFKQAVELNSTPQVQEARKAQAEAGALGTTPSVAGNDQTNLIQDVFTSPQEKRERRKLELQEKKLENQEKQTAQKEKADRFKATKEERNEIIKEGRQARQELDDLDRLEELSREAKLDTPGYVEFLKRSGLDFPALMNPESEEFQKIAQNFTRNAKNYFGGRVSNFEVEQFLKTIPSLSQSPQGRLRVIANLKNIARAKSEYLKTYQEIMKENGRIPPYDLLEQVEDHMEKKYERLAKQFKDDLKKEAPKGQNKLISALQAAAGSVVGAPGSLIGKISGAAGNLLGSGLP